MCQLLALNANAPTAATFSFTGLCARGGDTGHHVDGWGLAFHDGDVPRVFRDTARACDAPLAAFLRQHPLRARNVLAHVRKATQGAVALANCHPFQREWNGRSWLFAHNGNLAGFDPALDGSHLPVGQTDSEHAFCWLLQELRRSVPAGVAPDWHQVAPALAELLPRVASHGTFNLLLSDGHALYAHASTQLSWVERSHPFPRAARLVDRDVELDLAAANGPDDRMVVVATQPLTDDEPWRAFAPGELRVFVDGASVWRRVLRPVANKGDLDDRAGHSGARACSGSATRSATATAS
jgi:predicted glutamine amidotransferase